MSVRTTKSVIMTLVSISFVAACGGGAKKSADSTAAAAAAAAAPVATVAAKPVTGKVWEVKMVGDAQGYRFEPKTLTIKPGDGVKWTMVSGGPHDVTFWTDSIPAGAQPQLQANMPGATGPLTAPMTINAGDSFSASFAGVAPGVYHYYCTPHLAMNMTGTITVQ